MEDCIIRLKQLIKLSKRMGLDQIPWFRNSLEKLSLPRIWDERLYEYLLAYCVSNYTGPLLDTTFPMPLRREDLEAVTTGPYRLGTIISSGGIEFRLTDAQINRHILISGETGSGKSTLAKILAPQFIEEGLKVWIFDPKGRDYRFLARMFDNVIILQPPVLRLNPFGPIPGVTRDVLRETVSEVTSDSFAVFEPTEGIIIKHIQAVFERYQQPTFLDFLDSVSTEARSSGRMANYLDTIYTREMKIRASMGQVMNCKDDYFSKLYNSSIVVETQGLSDLTQRILLNWMIMKLHLYCTKNPANGLTHVLVFDEAQAQIFSRNQEYRGGRTPFMAKIASQGRSAGLGLIALAQNPATRILPEVVANTGVKVCLHPGSAVEMDGMSAHMGLSEEQRQRFHRLKKREAICKTGTGYMEPVLLEIDEFIDQPMSDRELEELMKPRWDRLLEGIEPAREPRPHHPLPLPKAGSQPGLQPSPVGAPAGSEAPGEGLHEQPESLSDDEQAYLRIVRSHPWRLVTEVYRILNDEKVMGTETISQARAVRIRKALLARGYLESYTVVATGRQGKAQSDVVTEKAGMGKAEKPRGDNPHGFWCYRVSGSSRQKGAEARIGDTLGGNELDVTAEINGRRIGIEVVLTSLSVENIPNHLKYCDELLILVPDERRQKQTAKLIEILSGDIREKVRVDLLKNYFITL